MKFFENFGVNYTNCGGVWCIGKLHQDLFPYFIINEYMAGSGYYAPLNQTLFEGMIWFRSMFIENDKTNYKMREYQKQLYQNLNTSAMVYSFLISSLDCNGLDPGSGFSCEYKFFYIG